MKGRSRKQPSNRQLELRFEQLILRLGPEEQQRVREELQRPFRRQWWVVDERGVRWLE